ncbi:restriction endonuclease subunit S [Mycoplasma sp. 1232]|uniref:restriction endonuclease subunit S n=1 Tax=Mycoplasma sp. 1232 TaxID=3108527 RepID=UPI002B260353|nr:restriction endonuclease subunit S [Mycoplasma sp. 1232]MEA4333849.1 restriction endonuclease subunit S [Mycoplasma sp. 1232]
MKKLSEYIIIANGKHNTQDCVQSGIYPFFDRSEVVKFSNNYLFDDEAIIMPGEGTSFIPRYYNGKFDLHQRCYCIRIKNSDLDIKYLYYYLYYHRDYFNLVATGSTVKSLRLVHFLDMPVSFHEKPTQSHIVNTITILPLISF